MWKQVEEEEEEEEGGRRRGVAAVVSRSETWTERMGLWRTDQGRRKKSMGMIGSTDAYRRGLRKRWRNVRKAGLSACRWARPHALCSLG